MWGSTWPCSGGWTYCDLPILGSLPAETGPLLPSHGADGVQAFLPCLSGGLCLGCGKEAWPWWNSPLWHGLMAKGQHREKTLESWWRQDLPSTPGTCNTQLSPLWRLFLGGTCLFPPFFLYSLHLWLTIHLRWGRKSLNLERLCSPCHFSCGLGSACAGFDCQKAWAVYACSPLGSWGRSRAGRTAAWGGITEGSGLQSAQGERGHSGTAWAVIHLGGDSACAEECLYRAMI